MRHDIASTATVALLFLFGPSDATAVQEGPLQEVVVAADQTPLYGTLGDWKRPVTTSSEVAQAYFDEGLQLVYAFGIETAVHSFRAGRTEDPACAMCWWGEARALGPYLNGGMGPEAEREAYGVIQEALSLVPEHTTPVEAALIEAMAIRYVEDPEDEPRARLDSLYADAMGEVAQRFPDDLDVQTFWAESLMLLRPRRGWVELDDPSVREILEILEPILEEDLAHPGACHLYIHLVEASGEPERAEPCSDLLADAIPGASHIQHMPSHIYMTIGRYGDAVRHNLRARHADERAAYGGVPGIYPAHNLHMLVFSSVFDGQSAIALQAARDLARVSAQHAFYLPVTLAIFGRWDEVLELHERPEDPFLEGMWRWARAMAHLRTGREGSAGDELDRLRQIETEVAPEASFRHHSQQALLSIPRAILEGEMAAARGDPGGAIRALQEAVQAKDALIYDEPEPWHLPPRLVLGALLLEMDRPQEAENVYRAALEQHPSLGWALFGLTRALERQGRVGAAEDVRGDFEEAWARSDIWLRASRF